MTALVEVTFLPDPRTAWVAAGTTLLAASLAAGVDVLTGCTRGMCGTDAVRIVDGQTALAPPGDAERGTLERMGLSADFRLVCSARVLAGRVVVDPRAF